MQEKIKLIYFTDILCIWAYIAQVRLDELKKNFGSLLDIEYRFLPVFGAVKAKIEKVWGNRGGAQAYSKHVQEVCKNFNHIEISDQVWQQSIPESSANTHLFIKAIQIVQPDVVENLLWQLRLAYFKEASDISNREVQKEFCSRLKIDSEKVQATIESGKAMAAMIEDIELKEKYHIVGSPTYILNEGRQILYGNVGYRVLEANVKELTENPKPMASWC